MRRLPQKPVWWALNLIFGVMLALMILEHWLPFSDVGHQWALATLIVIGYGAVALWIHANRAALSASSRDRRRDLPPLRWTVYRTRDSSVTRNGDDHEPDDE
jgi:hypothetical protein